MTEQWLATSEHSFELEHHANGNGLASSPAATKLILIGDRVSVSEEIPRKVNNGELIKTP